MSGGKPAMYSSMFVGPLFLVGIQLLYDKITETRRLLAVPCQTEIVQIQQELAAAHGEFLPGPEVNGERVTRSRKDRRKVVHLRRRLGIVYVTPREHIPVR